MKNRNFFFAILLCLTLLLFNNPFVESTSEFIVRGPIKGLLAVSAKTANYTLTSSDVWGGVFSNEGAIGEITFTLPKIVTAGQKCHITTAAAQNIKIDPNISDTIVFLTDSAGDRIASNGSIGSAVTLISISTTKWMPYVTGDWTDAN